MVNFKDVGVDKDEVVNSSGTVINPATEDGNLATIAGVDFATQTTLSALNAKVVPSVFYTHDFPSAAVGATQDVTAVPKRSFSIQCVAVGGTMTAWNVNLEVSLNGTTWTTIMSHATSDGDSNTKCTGLSHYPARYFRANATVITLNTASALTVNVLAE